jgi:origin recognition complex subunit 2
VLRTLVQNARKVFRVLADAQLDDPAAGGVPFPALLRMCRERFLVSNEAGLRAHLTEFRDHELVRTRPAADGGEALLIPLAAEPLRRVLAEMDAGGGGGGAA